MNMTKKINVNFSSLVGLKAELLRKQAEVNEAKLKTESINASPLLNKKKNKKIVADNVEENTKRSLDSEDIVAHKKSKLMLEAKARLYQKLKKSKNNNDKFLVDFENKLDEPDETFIDETIDKEYPTEPEENWVEYQDCFGRTRKCLREDLPHMQKKDELIKHEIMKKHIDENEEKEDKEQYPIQEKEPEIEIMRRKWEEQTRKLTDKVDIHYQDVLFDEARTHGVGYYMFSQDEDKRVKQQENLANLRKETEKKQKEMKEVKELKERLEQNRLKAAKIRQRIRAGLSAELTEEELAQEDKSTNSTDNINPDKDESTEKDKENSKEKVNPASASINESTQENKTNDEDKIRAFGELLDKKNYWHVMSQEEWTDKCRSQRISEFGPVYDNFKSDRFHNSSQNSNEQLTREENEELDNTEICNSQESIEESNSNLQNRGSSNDSVDNETIPIIKDIDSNGPKDKNDSPEYNAVDNSPESSENTIEPTLIPTVTLSNLSQNQATISYPLSHLSNNYSRNVCGYSEINTSERQTMDIPLPGENNILPSASSGVTYTNKQESLSRDINEDNIMAGLKYLRKKFEAGHSKWT
ncbi:PREDICTED: coiled-coil domain-containing protein 174 [Cyphomyrmex costatus]|uniref:coiled-coil domain-containing protein 174 n=1 Tax=Cyphomyrmex costatus TaxID=456900 RepID=UPI0008523AAE|nr:PREDICTED: coiled-coil domain-containing protein 174 [Cyphomyrmex costatus]